MAKAVLNITRFYVVDAEEEPIDFLRAIDIRAEMEFRAHSKSYLKITTERS
jgi:hypothetical protein